MREILFRAKRVDAKAIDLPESEKWACGFPVEHNGVMWIYTGEIKIRYDLKSPYGYEPYAETVKLHVDPSTVCQYTGLTDKERKKIFDGDICTVYNRFHEVDIIGVVRFGEYNQDGSGEEYRPVPVLGFYVETVTYTARNDWGKIPEFEKKTSLLHMMVEDSDSCVDHYENFRIIGNIFDNPELLKDSRTESEVE